MLLGVHCSISGGYKNAFIQASSLGIDTFQIFTKNQRQWKEKTVGLGEAEEFRMLIKETGIKVVLSHASYLINLASEDDQIAKNSIISLAAEVTRCGLLGISYAVFHPGSAKGTGEEKAIRKIVSGLKQVLQYTEGMGVKILLENTAGQGSSIGWKFEQLMEIIELTESERVGICLDTCHAFAAGYDIRTRSGSEIVFENIDRLIGLRKLYAIHLNDSKGALGSRVDRHDHIGKGLIGIEAFRFIMETFPQIPKVIETRKEGNMDEKNIKFLRSLI
jgi:deoxyribonuclease-4